MSPSFLLDQIVGIQHQIRALDCQLETLLKQLQKANKPDPLIKEPERGPMCPDCHEDLTGIPPYHVSGSIGDQYACPNCTYRGSAV